MLNVKLFTGIQSALAFLVTLAVSTILVSYPPAHAFQGAQPPERPTGLRVVTDAGSLDVSLDWKDVAGADEYLVRWRLSGPGHKLNAGVKVVSSGASITVDDYGEWVVRVEACNDAGCGEPLARRFEVEPAPETTPEPTPEPTPELTPEPTPEPAPANPTGLQVSTEPGSLDVSADWDDVDGATSYAVYWGKVVIANGVGWRVTVRTSSATATMLSAGQWALKVEACNDSGCGNGAVQLFKVEKAPEAPAKPAGLQASTQLGSLEVSLDWNDVDRATHYQVRWREGAQGTQLNEGVSVNESSAVITVSGYGEWVAKVYACTGENCGPGKSARFQVEEADGKAYRGQLAKVLVRFSLQGPAQDAETSGARSASDSSEQTPQTASIVYLVDDSGTMDGDFPEVRTALEAVRDTSMPNTKVALIGYGRPNFVTHFELTDHSSAPWNDYINEFGGKMGGNNYVPPMAKAKNLLKDDDADFKKIIFMTDGGGYICDGLLNTQLKEANIVVDSIGFGIGGDKHEWVISCGKSISTSTGGAYEKVPKPLQGTVNDPPVAVRYLEDILLESVASNTATLILTDESSSVPGSVFLTWYFNSAWLKALGDDTTGAQLGWASFLGENPFMETGKQIGGINFGPEYYLKYRVIIEMGVTPEVYAHSPNGLPWYHFGDGVNSPPLMGSGSTDIDNALKEAYSTVMAAEADNRRVVLISDGITAVDVQESTLSQYTDNGVILDVVASGSYADRVLLKSWAEATGGNYNSIECSSLTYLSCYR